MSAILCCSCKTGNNPETCHCQSFCTSSIQGTRIRVRKDTNCHSSLYQLATSLVSLLLKLVRDTAPGLSINTRHLTNILGQKMKETRLLGSCSSQPGCLRVPPMTSLQTAASGMVGLCLMSGLEKLGAPLETCWGSVFFGLLSEQLKPFSVLLLRCAACGLCIWESEGVARWDLKTIGV